MHSSTLHMIFILALFTLACAAFSSSRFHPCSDDFLGIDTYLEMMKERNNTTKCKKLSTLQAQFAWNYYKTSHNQTQINVLIGTKLITDMGWLAWGVNPDQPQMVGTSAIIAIKVPNQNTPVVNTYSITKDTKRHCALKPSEINVTVQNMRAQHRIEIGFFTIFATLLLHEKYNISSLNHVWQVGYFAEGLEPKMHSTSLQNFDSKEVLDMQTGHCQDVGHNRHHLRKIHGVLNIIGWGTLLPIGVIIARYFRQFPFKLEPWWFTFHYSCQALGYFLGSIGWGLGLLLGHESKYYSFHTHRVLGISIFGFTTLQMLAFRLKPTREDEYRKHWNVYHHFLGYSLLVMIPVNIYQGIKILKPDNRIWKWAYNGILVLLAMAVLAFEIYSWNKFLRSKYDGSKPGNGRPSEQKTGQASRSNVSHPEQKLDQASRNSSKPDQGTSKEPAVSKS
ncbi:cytochrome b561 and DOMON domain-containing protein At5g35735-like [Durio zibethinus]|uniref:Cytochrome b561 and DOMON domain-containing protein At5g35735-like n=1 Tax=Durio zibethinus TaxID=66656 RepID=A0A6P5Y544_DURZI|nr:cytochrome b561 and DOMON domain-containing protein At5g35735-like [Durio zibethinus]